MKLLKLITLGLRRQKSEKDYAALQTYIAELTVEQLKSKGVDLSQSHVLELASGAGGYSKVLNKASKSFIASDVRKSPNFYNSDIPFIEVDVLKTFPFEANTFDFIHCSSLIEHTPDPNNLLKESLRVLKSGGKMFLSFPPFYSLTLIGGYRFKPFHFLGEKAAVTLTNFF